MAERTPMQVANSLRDQANAFDRRNRARYDDWASLRAAIVEAITVLESVDRLRRGLAGDEAGT